MEYGRLVVLGYSSYRVASTRPADMVDGRHSTSSADADDMARSPVGVITSQQKKTEKDRRTIGQLWEPIGDQNAEYVLVKRKKGNGVKLHRFHHFMDARLRNPETESTDTSGKTDLKILTRRLLNAIEIRNKALQHTGTRSSSSEEEELLSPSWSTSSASSSSRVEPRDPVLPPSPSPCSFLMCIPMNDADAHASVTEYVADDTTDMFQIGRMPCRQNDVVIPGPRVGASGTISRFAARIVCQRDAPYECRLFAGGFDVGQKMTTAGHALKRCGKCGEWLKRVDADHKCIHDLMDEGFGHSNQRELHGDRVDHSSDASVPGIMDLEHIEMEMNNPANVPIDGLTKNGVRIWLPEEKKWFEVSVNGNLYGIAPRTPSMSSMRGRHASLNPDTSVRHSAFNRPTGGVANVPALLTDGAIIDLGGVQLQFQVPRRHEQGTDEDDDLVRASMALVDEVAGRTGDTIDSSVAAKMDKLNVHCPVQLHPLRFDRSSSEEDIDLRHVPHVFPACGHVFGYEKRLVKSKICPLCRKPGNLVRLRLKENFQLMPRAERTAVPECVFNPCGHAISHSLATHYSGLVMPNGRAICPFCAVHLDAKTPFSQLYLYSEGDSN